VKGNSVATWVIALLLIAVIGGALFPTIVTQFAAVTGANGITAIFSVMAVVLAAVFLWKIAGGAFGRSK